MIFTLVIGANLTTAADKGGSYALAEVQENSTEARVTFDRESLEETYTDTLVAAIWYHNWPLMSELGIHDAAPMFNIKQEKPQDPLQRAQVIQTMSGTGLRIAAQDAYEQVGLRAPKPGEEVLEPPAPAPAFPGGFGQ